VVIESIGKSLAVLLKNHGVFSVGKTSIEAVKAAVMTEDAAATVWMAMQLGTPENIPYENIEKLHDRYTHVYGQ
jgi:L-ribulose-5-phosphate 4-epimerase